LIENARIDRYSGGGLGRLNFLLRRGQENQHGVSMALGRGICRW
jgi:hypothetical protein